MPVVEISYSRLQKLVGKVSKRRISETLPFLGLDIESEEKDLVRVEYSPNRPDYSTDFGISLGLQGLLGIKLGSYKLKIKNSDYFKIDVNSSVSKIRPFVTGIIAKNGKIDDKIIKQLMTMQEDLHFGIGRKRKKSSIGIHDLDTISFPLTYTTTNRRHKFIPLNSQKESTISDILQNTEVGKEYGYVLGNSSNVPIILDSKGQTVSFPPIINSAITTVTTKTKNLFVEVTGINKEDSEDMLSVVATTLQAAGFSLISTNIRGSGNSTPKLSERKIIVKPSLINESLGSNMRISEMILALKKSRLDASIIKNKITCIVPSYRFDIFGEMDLVEEVALGYGIEKLTPLLMPSQTIGSIHPVSTKLKSVGLALVGLGYLEVLNSSLTSKRILYEMTNRKPENIISVLDSKSQEHTVLRDSILPGLLENLSRNIHSQYPQKLFEIGKIFLKNNPIDEKTSLGVVCAHQEVHFSEVKSILQAIMKTCFNLQIETRATSDDLFEEGRIASIVANGKKIGVIGEINSKTIDESKIRVPVVGFEINLSGLIFD